MLSPPPEVQAAIPHGSMAIGPPIAAADPIPRVRGDPFNGGDALPIAAPHREGEGPAVRREGPREGTRAPGPEPPGPAKGAPILHESQRDLPLAAGVPIPTTPCTLRR